MDFGGDFFFIKTDFPKTSKSVAGSGTHSLSRVSGTEEEYHSQKPKLNTIKPDHQMDGWPLCARLRSCPEISQESNSVQTTKVPTLQGLRSPVCVYI